MPQNMLHFMKIVIILTNLYLLYFVLMLEFLQFDMHKHQYFYQLLF